MAQSPGDAELTAQMVCLPNPHPHVLNRKFYLPGTNNGFGRGVAKGRIRVVWPGRVGCIRAVLWQLFSVVACVPTELQQPMTTYAILVDSIVLLGTAHCSCCEGLSPVDFSYATFTQQSCSSSGPLTVRWRRADDLSGVSRRGAGR